VKFLKDLLQDCVSSALHVRTYLFYENCSVWVTDKVCYRLCLYEADARENLKELMAPALCIGKGWGPQDAGSSHVPWGSTSPILSLS
jgi:hypothetical protein